MNTYTINVQFPDGEAGDGAIITQQPDVVKALEYAIQVMPLLGTMEIDRVILSVEREA